VLRAALLLFGLLTFSGLLWHIGPSKIIGAIENLGAVAILIVLMPSVLMYAVEAFGWQLTLGEHGRSISFARLFAIRTAGEVVNMTTPTAYAGGEPLKAYVLSRYGVPLVAAMASVVTAKTTMTVAEGLFVAVGIVLTFVAMGADRVGLPEAMESSVIVAVTLLLAGTTALLVLQRRGLFTGLLRLLRRLRIRVAFLESREAKLMALDRAIKDFYEQDRRRFYASIAAFFLGWLAEALEVYAILFFLGPPPGVAVSISIGALAVLIKGGTFFIPGSVGAQEAGNVMLLLAYGYSDLDGITFALLRRVRELVWIFAGLICLGVLRGFKAVAAPEANTTELP
jgi:uncharacterized protein (TIRG00374 family)